MPPSSKNLPFTTAFYDVHPILENVSLLPYIVSGKEKYLKVNPGYIQGFGKLVRMRCHKMI